MWMELVNMGIEKTGKPKQLRTWEDTQYLDLERRQIHVPAGRIRFDMLDEDLQRAIGQGLPIGYYSGDGSTSDTGLDEIGRVVFIPIRWGNSKYGMCVYGSDVALYGTARYGEATYRGYVPKTGKYSGSGGYGYVRYG